MALLVWFKKIHEDSTEVTYVFGYPEMDRQLVISKASEEGRPVDGNRDRDFAAVYTKIVRYVRSDRVWPTMGSYAA